jgi:hypothetical protein
LCAKNYYIDDDNALFRDEFKNFEHNTLELRDYTFHCNNGEEFSVLDTTTEFKEWDIWDYYFVKGA